MKLFRRKAVPTPVDPDFEVLAHLLKAGSDLSKPHEVELFLNAPNEAAAKLLADKLTSLGAVANVQPAPDGHPGYSALGTITMVPELEALQNLRIQLEAEAARCGGEYDGWGTMVVKSTDEPS